MTGYHVLLRRPKEGEETLIVCVSEMGNTATADTDTGTDLDTKPESTDGRREGSGRGLGSYKRDDPVLNSGRREVCRRFWGHRRRSAVAVASEMA